MLSAYCPLARQRCPSAFQASKSATGPHVIQPGHGCCRALDERCPRLGKTRARAQTLRQQLATAPTTGDQLELLGGSP